MLAFSMASQAILSLSDSSITNGALQGDNATSQVFRVINTGSDTNAYTITTNSYESWVSVVGGAGTLTNNAFNTVTLNYDTAALTAGIQTTQLFVATSGAGGGTQVVSVVMQVWSRPVLSVNPLVITQIVDKGANPTSGCFTVGNGSEAPVVSMSYRVAVTNDMNSLIQGVSPNSGVSSGEQNAILLSFNNISAYAAGSYTALVAVAATNFGSGYSGNWSDARTVTVVTVVAAPDAPANLNASKGLYNDRVALCWEPSHSFGGGAVTYNVLRYTTFDPTYAATIVSGISATNFDDISVQAGVRYYYWVQCVNAYGEHGTNSVCDNGYMKLPAPVGVFASNGEYTDKVLVSWSTVDGASSYYVYRSGGGSSGIVYHASGTEYHDNLVSENIAYTYQVQATNSICASDLSAGEVGCVLSRPAAVNASAGLYVGKIGVSWTPVPGAVTYEVWRSLQTLTPPHGGGVKIGETSATAYDDTAVTAGTIYYYWVKAKSTLSVSDWSARVNGYAASAGVTLSTWGLVVHPLRVGPGGCPRVISVRLENAGGAALAGDNGTLSFTLYASTNATFGAGVAISAGTVSRNVSLAVGSSEIVNLDASSFHLPASPGFYYLFLKVIPDWPSLLAPSSAEGFVARRAHAVEVSEHGSFNYQAMNDYNGDGMSDITVAGAGIWDAITADGYLLANGFVFGGNAQPVMGDYDGDCKTDPVMYESSRGVWQALLSGSGYAYVIGSLGGPWCRVVPGDYDGDGRADAAVYDMANSLWYAMKVGGRQLMWGLRFGNPGYDPVIGDYDGDGVWDLAMYDEPGGLWYIRTISGALILSGESWGGSGFSAVPGDYDGDGIADMALYNRMSGRWSIRAVSGGTIISGVQWGATGYLPVQGDFDGDGVADLAVYNESTGKWFIRTVAGTNLVLDGTWGGPGHTPVGTIDE